MVFIISALTTALVGSSPLLLKKKLKVFAWFSAISFVVLWLIYYLAMPSLEYTLFGMAFVLTSIAMIVSGIFASFEISYGESEFKSGWTLSPGLLAIAILFLTLISGYSGCGNATRYAGLIGDLSKEGKNLKHWTQQNQELSPTHIRVVPVEHAISIAKTALNQHADGSGNIVGSQFEIDENRVTLQKVGNDLCYVCPLDFRSWGAYNSGRSVPGYVLVNAEDQHAIPKYVDGYAMRFTPGAYFGQNLQRYLYTNGYANKILMDYSFEIDDQMNPFWVVSVCHHTIGMFSGIVVDGVVIVNPQNGNIQYYSIKDVPSWVDRVIPAEIVNQYISYWGKFQNGFWNNTSVGGQANLRTPETTLLNYGADGTCWYVTPVTSNNEKDKTMTDLIYTNSRTGESHRYVVSGSTEDAILKTVDATVGFQKLHSTAIVYENVGDRMTALVPVLAEDHSIRGLALVDVATKSISWDADPVNALTKYQMSMSSNSTLGTDVATVETTIKGKVARIAQGVNTSGDLYYVYFEGGHQIFVVNQSFREVLITNVGDNVEIHYLETTTDLVPAKFFDNLDLDIKGSKNQQEVTNRIQARREDEAVNASRGSVKATIYNGEIDPSVLDSVARKIGRKNN
jgi:hypothetical protein